MGDSKTFILVTEPSLYAFGIIWCPWSRTGNHLMWKESVSGGWRQGRSLLSASALTIAATSIFGNHWQLTILYWAVEFGIREIQSNGASGTGPNCVVSPCQWEYPQLPRPLGPQMPLTWINNYRLPRPKPREGCGCLMYDLNCHQVTKLESKKLLGSCNSADVYTEQPCWFGWAEPTSFKS